MTTPLVQACWTVAVTLGLYAFYCHWEAGRADLVAAHRHYPRSPHPSGAGVGGSGSSYRARARWAFLGAALMAATCLAPTL